jgi:hypothetical protein
VLAVFALGSLVKEAFNDTCEGMKTNPSGAFTTSCSS